MMELFARKRRQLTRPVRFARPTLERLDARDLPAAPTVTGLGGQIIGSTMIVYGQVQDDNPAADTVTAGGAISASKTTPGEFEFIAPYGGNGTVVIDVLDDEGLNSTQYSIVLTPSSSNQQPYVTFSVAYGTNRYVTLSGTVYDENPMMTSVSISGAASATSLFPNSQGQFSVTLMATALGDVNARATEMFTGIHSNLAARLLESKKPRITEFEILTAGTNLYTLRGYVTDESAPGLGVIFRSLEINPINGAVATVYSNNFFEKTFQLSSNPDECGVVYAKVEDWWGLWSNEVWEILYR